MEKVALVRVSAHVRLYKLDSFGLHVGDCEHTRVAKIEKKSARSTLPHEYDIYRRLSKLACIPKVYFFGEESGYYGLVLENVGNPIEDLFWFRNKKTPEIDSASLAATLGVLMVSPFPLACLIANI